MKNKITTLFLLSSNLLWSQNNSFPTTGNAKIFAVNESWAEGLSIVRSSGWSGIRLTRNDPAGGNYNGNWAIGYTAGTGNDFSISTNYNGTQYDGILHLSNTTRNVGIGTTTPADQLEIVRGNRKVGFNTDLGISNGGMISFTRPDDGLKTMHIGSSASPADDNVIWSQGGSSELRLISNGGPYAVAGFGFYNNVPIADAFGGQKPIPYTPALKIDGNGNVGIGTATPTAGVKLDVVGLVNLNSLSINSVNSNSSIYFKNHGANDWDLGTQVGEANQNFNLYNRGTSSIAISVNKSTSNVGVGTNDPGSFKLAVNGKIWAQEVQVATNRPPDYVFEPDYKLLSLEEIKSYIEKNKHLPEVPSAKEMETNGVNMSEMNMLLLKKIEELTLHLIKQSKINEEQKSINAKLQQEIVDLKQSLK